MTKSLRFHLSRSGDRGDMEPRLAVVLTRTVAGMLELKKQYRNIGHNVKMRAAAAALRRAAQSYGSSERVFLYALGVDINKLRLDLPPRVDLELVLRQDIRLAKGEIMRCILQLAETPEAVEAAKQTVKASPTNCFRSP